MKIDNGKHFPTSSWSAEVPGWWPPSFKFTCPKFGENLHKKVTKLMQRGETKYPSIVTMHKYWPWWGSYYAPHKQKLATVRAFELVNSVHQCFCLRVKNVTVIQYTYQNLACKIEMVAPSLPFLLWFVGRRINLWYGYWSLQWRTASWYCWCRTSWR